MFDRVRIAVSMALLITLVFTMTVAAQQEDRYQRYPETDMVIGFSLPTIGWTHYNDRGKIDSLNGINAGLGYSWRGYFGDGVDMGEFNGYWGAGTMAILVPYLEIGTTYAQPLGEGEDSLLAVDMGVLYIIPYLSLSVWF
ncbi:MAG: hypothetical protein ACOCZX_04435 [Candidatus Bipolaricaulota bacterium]